ncbi:MAG: co-chaperone DjlA [Gammaproteobacteria bacterium]|nr:co-chaperone DjlA [Gammaproteobacteria bacterium]MCP5423661.1 co-chaperone DjlA [Gammaproteobacteria bacterium]
MHLNWWGKLLGSGLGFMLGGPLGAMVGMAVGHNIDTGAFGRIHKPGAIPGDKSQQAAQVFFNATFRVMGHLAKRDGRVSEHEIAAAQAVMIHMRLTPSQKQTAINLFREGKHPDFNLDAALTLLIHHCGDQPPMIRRFIDVQLSTAYVDGVLHPSKRALLLHICDQLKFSRVGFEALDAFVKRRQQSSERTHQYNRAYQEQRREQRSRPSSPPRKDSLAEAYATLGVTRTAKEDEIKLAYRKLISRYHPDKLAARNLSKELIAKTTEKTREIKAAYERIKQARGF